MRVTKFGHSCLHVTAGSASILLDPGAFSSGFESLTGLTAVLLTHQHFDHVDADKLMTLLAANPGAAVHADAQPAAILGEKGIEVTTVQAADEFDVGVPVSVYGARHAVIHKDIPVISNVAYLIDGRLLHPGDSFTEIDRAVDILALPVSAPWMAVKEAVEYVRSVSPAYVIPIHEQVLSRPAMVYGMVEPLLPKSSRWVLMDDGQTREF